MAKSKNVIWADGYVKPEDFEKRNGHKSAVLWFTGLSGSGKSTLAKTVQKKLFETGCQVMVLDGDNIRHGLNGDLGFTSEARKENIRRISEVAKLFQQAGFIVITAFISPYREDRDRARSIVEPDAFLEVFIDSDIETCKQRDPKGLYKKALANEIPNFTGISAPYEAPLKPELVVPTAKASVEESASMVISQLAEHGILPDSL